MDVPASSLPRRISAADLPFERLATSTQIPEEDKVREAGRQFEALLLRNILTQASKSTLPSKFMPKSTSASIYQDMINNNLADQISRSGALGLTRGWEHQLGREFASATRPPESHRPTP